SGFGRGVEQYTIYRRAPPDELIPIFETNRINVVVAGGQTNGHFSIFMGSPMRAKFRSMPGPTVPVDAWREGSLAPGEEAVRGDRRGCAVTGGGDCLAGRVGADVAGGEQAW